MEKIPYISIVMRETLKTPTNMNPFKINYAEELRPRIGFPVSENFSPTLRAKLVSINEGTGMCTMEILKSPYKDGFMGSNHNDMVGMRYERPLPYVWNAYNF